MAALRSKAGTSTFNAALSRNGFTASSFSDYQRALLTEVALMRAMAGDRARSAAGELRPGATFAPAAARWSDDPGPFARGGGGGGLRPAARSQAPVELTSEG